MYVLPGSYLFQRCIGSSAFALHHNSTGGPPINTKRCIHHSSLLLFCRYLKTYIHLTYALIIMVLAMKTKHLTVTPMMHFWKVAVARRSWEEFVQQRILSTRAHTSMRSTSPRHIHRFEQVSGANGIHSTCEGEENTIELKEEHAKEVKWTDHHSHSLYDYFYTRRD